MLNAEVFRVMKRTAIVVNVSRGAVIAEEALIAALQAGTIGGAGLDVFAEEPLKPGHALLTMDQVLATPHVGGVTRQSYDGIAAAVAANVTAVREGRPPAYCVNVQAIPR
jgi:phosphoglycerate dehydrogenase-like enzyme